MVPTPFWERQWSSHLNEREKTKDNQHDARKAKRAGALAEGHSQISGLKSYVPASSPEPKAAREESHATARACGPGCTSRHERQTSAAPAPELQT